MRPICPHCQQPIRRQKASLPRGPQSNRMLAVLDAVASLPLATSPTIAERCGITVAQAAVSLHYLAKAGRARRKDIAMSAQGRPVIVWGIA